MANQTLTAIAGLRVGHAQDDEAKTGCTVILCPPNTVGGIDQRGGAPATRETDLLRPMHLVQHVNAILLTGGSAFGLAAADGVMRYLEERGIGFQTPDTHVPIVPAAAIYDLNVGRADRRPDAAMGYAACEAATGDPVHQGWVGAGVGAKVGSMMGVAMSSAGGVGSASLELGSGLIIGALVVVNAFGDVVDADGQIIAGLRAAPDSPQFAGTLNLLTNVTNMTNMSQRGNPGTNTVIGVVATNARLSKEETNKLAQMAQDGIAQAVRPAHTLYDGDTLFALATGEVQAEAGLVSAFAAEVTAAAIRNAVRSARDTDSRSQQDN